jgi:hypothetical protein
LFHSIAVSPGWQSEGDATRRTAPFCVRWQAWTTLASWWAKAVVVPSTATAKTAPAAANADRERMMARGFRGRVMAGSFFVRRRPGRSVLSIRMLAVPA